MGLGLASGPSGCADARCGWQVWRTKKKGDFVRVFHEGTVVPGYEWIPLNTFISSLEAQIPENIFEQCNVS